MSDGEVFDLDALEDDGKPFRFQFGGEQFEFPSDPPVVALEYMAKGDLQQGLFVLLGEEQYHRLDGLDELMGYSQQKALFDRYAKHTGISLGKSSGPSRSARRMLPS